MKRINKSHLFLRFSLLATAFCLSASAIAGKALPHPQVMLPANDAYVALFGGMAWTRSGDSMNLLLAPPLLTNRYVANFDYREAPVLGIAFGYLRRWRRFNLLAGIEGGYTRVVSPPGVVHPMFQVNQQFDTLDFRYVVRSLPAMVVSTFQYKFKEWMPYLIAGLGVSWNEASDYQEVPTDPSGSATAMRSPFRSDTTFDFAYTVGGGVAYALNQFVRLSVEYRYTNYGDVHLSPALTQVTSTPLLLGTVSSEAVMLRLSTSLRGIA